MTPGIIKKLYHTTPVGLTDEDKQEVYPITATSAVYSAPGESSFPNMSLDNILDALNQGYQYMGKATPTTNPGVYNHKVFYLASDPGTYSYFGNIEVSSLTVLKTSGNGWTADVFNITGGGGGGTAAGYIGTTMVQNSPAPQNLGGISQLNLTSGARIYFGETAYIELDQYGFHFSQGIYSDSFVAAGGIGSGGGGGGGGSYTPGNGISIVNDEISVKIGTGLAFDASGNLTATGGGSYVLPIASASTLGGIKVGSGLSIDSSGVLSAIGGTEGTVTSITLNSGTGIAVSDSGTAITTSGSRTISINSSYRNKIDHGDTAYSWGNHAAAGYADASVVNAALAEKQNVISDLETIRSNASRGNTAYGWGNHALAGYAMAADLTSLETRVISIEDWFEIVTVNGQQALHAKSGRAIYSDSWVAAGGIGSGSSGGGTDLNRVWDSLTNNTDKPNVKINIAHIPDITISKITDLESWIAGKGYLTSYTETDPTVPAWAKASSKPSYSLSEISGTSDLQSIEALTGTSGFLKKTAENTWALDTTQYLSAHQSVTLASGTNNGTLKLTTAAGTVDNIAVKGLQALAYKASLLASDIPDLSGTYVTLGTAQTITGDKTFTGFLYGDENPDTHDYYWRIDDDGTAAFGTLHVGGVSVVPANYVTLSGAQTITGGKTFSGGIVMDGADIVPSADLGSQLGYSGRRFSNINVRTVGSVKEIIFKHQTTGNNDGLIAGADGYFRFRTGANINTSFKEIIFHENYGLYPEVGSSVNLGYYSSTDNRFRWANIYAVNADLSGNLDVAGVVRVNSLNTIDQRSETMSLFNFGARSTKTFNAYGLGLNLRAHDANGTQMNILAVNATKIQAGSDLIPNYTEGLNLGGSSVNTRWATIYGVNEDLSGDLSMAQTSHIDIGPARIEYDATNGAIHVTTSQTGNDAPVIGFYADGFSAAGGVGEGGSGGYGVEEITTNQDGTIDFHFTGGNITSVNLNHEHSQYLKCVPCENQAAYDSITNKDNGTLYPIGGNTITKVYLGTTVIFSEN